MSFQIFCESCDHMQKFTCEFIFTCENSHDFTCENTHVNFHIFYFILFYLNTLLDKYIPKGRSANETRGPMQGTPPIRHITHKTYK